MSEALVRLAEIEDAEYGHILLRLLVFAGWDVAITRAFVGDGILIVLSKDGLPESRAQGSSVAELAPQLFSDAVHAQRDKRERRPLLRVVE